MAWLGTETNQFGTDEFMKWCEVIGTEPYLCLNFGTGTLDEGTSTSNLVQFHITNSTQLWPGSNIAMARATPTTPTSAGKMVMKSPTMYEPTILQQRYLL